MSKHMKQTEWHPGMKTSAFGTDSYLQSLHVNLLQCHTTPRIHAVHGITISDEALQKKLIQPASTGFRELLEWETINFPYWQWLPDPQREVYYLKWGQSFAPSQWQWMWGSEQKGKGQEKGEDLNMLEERLMKEHLGCGSQGLHSHCSNDLLCLCCQNSVSSCCGSSASANDEWHPVDAWLAKAETQESDWWHTCFCIFLPMPKM